MMKDEVKEKIRNVRAMARNISIAPANEQFLGEVLSCISQGFHDIADLLEAITEYKVKS